MKIKHCEERIPIFLIFMGTSLLLSCQDFDQFDCFNEPNGCRQELNEGSIEVMSGGEENGGNSWAFVGGGEGAQAGTIVVVSAGIENAGENSSGESAGEALAGENQGGETSAGEMSGGDDLTGGVLHGGNDISDSDPSGGDLSGGDMSSGGILGGGMAGGSIPNPNQRPSWCTFEEELDDRGIGILWECVEGPNQQFYQVSVGEVSLGYLIKKMNDHGLCGPSGMLGNNCSEQAINRRLESVFGEVEENSYTQEQRNIVYNSPVSFISPSEIEIVIRYLNINHLGIAHFPSYRLMTLAEWRHLRGNTQETEYSCSEMAMNGVFKPSESNSQGQVRCNQERPRAIRRNDSSHRCREEIRDDEDRRFNIPSYDGSSDPYLCDVHGNMKEVLSQCQSNNVLTYCVLGGGFRDSPVTQIGVSVEQALLISMNNKESSIGFRLVRTFSP